MAKNYWADSGTTASDGDGLSDDFEVNVLGTNPNSRDAGGGRIAVAGFQGADWNAPSATQNLDPVE